MTSPTRNHEKYLFDTFAIVEILNGNPHYQPFLESGMVINDFVYAEVAYYFFQRFPWSKALEFLQPLPAVCLRADPPIVNEAMRLRLQWKKRKVSTTDCISYVMAKKVGIKFLTGDKQFEGEENVEFVR